MRCPIWSNRSFITFFSFSLFSFVHSSENSLHPLRENTPITVLRDQATGLRAQAKELHDRGNFEQSAIIFDQAATDLHTALSYIPQCNNLTQPEQDQLQQIVTAEYATCRLHQALCQHKQKQFLQSIHTCSLVLNQTQQHSILSAPIQARAHLRRAKAYYALGQLSSTTHDDTNNTDCLSCVQSAFEDARTAAFLGDANAVAFYGRLMRNSSSLSSSSPSSTQEIENIHTTIPSFLSQSSQTSSLTDLLMPILSSSSSSSSSTSSTSKPAFHILNSIVSQFKHKETQELLCRHVSSLTSTQIQSLASLVGIPLETNMANKLVSLAQKVSPKNMDKTLKLIQGVYYVGHILWKFIRVGLMYRHFVVYYVEYLWIRKTFS